MYPDVIVTEEGSFNISVTQVSPPTCHATVIPTVYYTERTNATFAPTPEPTLPPATPVYTRRGEPQTIKNRGPLGIYATWLFPELGDSGFTTFYSATFEVTEASCGSDRRMAANAGCDYYYGLRTSDGCKGDTVANEFLYTNDSAVHTIDFNVQVTTTGSLWLVLHLGECYATVTPTITYTLLPPPTQTPRTLSPPTPAPPTNAPLTTLVPLTLAPPTPGHLCPKYEAESLSTVHMVACGAAKCRASTYFPLSTVAQACDPCVGGMLPFNMDVQKGTTADYTITFALAAGKAVTLEVACGTCTAMQGVYIEIPCGHARGGNSGGLASWVIVVIAIGAVAGVVLLGLGVRKMRSNADRMRALEALITNGEDDKALQESNGRGFNLQTTSLVS
eukprot:Rhum_TRINITY_DN15299_c3_g1::Rhum_TRINITY_DN15299_c3_g1_i4::g.149550::m.149550